MCDASSYGRYLDDVVGKQLDRIVEGFKKVQLSILFFSSRSVSHFGSYCIIMISTKVLLGCVLG